VVVVVVCGGAKGAGWVVVLSVVVVPGDAVGDGLVTTHPPKEHAPPSRRKLSVTRALRLSIFVFLANIWLDQGELTVVVFVVVSCIIGCVTVFVDFSRTVPFVPPYVVSDVVDESP
jgi:hypothetical protein